MSRAILDRPKTDEEKIAAIKAWQEVNNPKSARSSIAFANASVSVERPCHPAVAPALGLGGGPGDGGDALQRALRLAGDRPFPAARSGAPGGGEGEGGRESHPAGGVAGAGPPGPEGGGGAEAGGRARPRPPQICVPGGVGRDSAEAGEGEEGGGGGGEGGSGHAGGPVLAGVFVSTWGSFV
ncbi:uncharacterized protein BDZ99DRAFT_562387 [Mytilinidion resinicola]|uniref:Uncharacterized protein n=1 Tax=Mytilinidion resinicola TaxID=574789 RepID=A0A6A6YTI6_9PEZI|nr:uncharacterized protein BDZ99DRAFT_562387 [Mytilinidion resinicola]KAF2811275.1 hypothetical protein BDZ99DRAFT_562387 [Mytilinidion resinicola]